MAGDYADNQIKDAKAKRALANDPNNNLSAADRTRLNTEADTIDAKWGEGGSARVGLHTLIGALSGGLSGAAGAFASASVADQLNQLQSSLKDSFIKAGIDADTSGALAGLAASATATGLGAVASGGSATGAAVSLNVDTNNRQIYWQNFLAKKASCNENPSATGCATILKMAGVKVQVLDFMSTPTSNVAVNTDENGKVVSYTILDKATNAPILIMEPLEFDAFRTSSPGQQALLKIASQYKLGFGSAGINISAGNTNKALESLYAGFTSSDYALDVLFGLAGASASAISLARPGIVSVTNGSSIGAAVTDGRGVVGISGWKVGDNLLNNATASGDTVYHAQFSTAIGDDSATVNNFKNAADTGNGHNAIVHGQLTYDDLGGIPAVNGRPTNPAQIAVAIKSNPNYVEGAQVCFASCWSGSSGTAQELANYLNAPIFAPSRPVAWDVTTKVWIFDTDVFGTQIKNPQIKPEWKMFYPEKK